MKRRWKVLIGLILLLLALAVLNAFAANRETQPARVTVEGGEILELPGGALQVLDVAPSEPPASTEGGGENDPSALPLPPIVLIHGYTGSINWWQEVIPLLSRHHRVIAFDLLGHGGSAKPSSGYTVAGQADLIAQALNELGVEGAVLVGHSLGGTIAVAVTERASELVDRLVIIGMAPSVGEYGDLSLLSKISRLPVLGQAIKRITPDPLARRGLEQGFAPGFPVPDFALEDLRRMTFPAYHDWPDANRSFTDESPLDDRIESSFVPLLAIFGAEDQIFNARTSLSAYAALEGAQTELIEGVGHSPMVEAPERTAELLEAFATPPPAPEAGEAEPTPELAQPRSRNEDPPASNRQSRSAHPRQPSARQRQRRQAERPRASQSPG